MHIVPRKRLCRWFAVECRDRLPMIHPPGQSGLLRASTLGKLDVLSIAIVTKMCSSLCMVHQIGWFHDLALQRSEVVKITRPASMSSTGFDCGCRLVVRQRDAAIYTGAAKSRARSRDHANAGRKCSLSATRLKRCCSERHRSTVLVITAGCLAPSA